MPATNAAIVSARAPFIEERGDRYVARRDARPETRYGTGGGDQRQAAGVAARDRIDTERHRVDHWVCMPVPDV